MEHNTLHTCDLAAWQPLHSNHLTSTPPLAVMCWCGVVCVCVSLLFVLVVVVGVCVGCCCLWYRSMVVVVRALSHLFQPCICRDGRTESAMGNIRSLEKKFVSQHAIFNAQKKKHRQSINTNDNFCVSTGCFNLALCLQ